MGGRGAAVRPCRRRFRGVEHAGGRRSYTRYVSQRRRPSGKRHSSPASRSPPRARALCWPTCSATRGGCSSPRPPRRVSRARSPSRSPPLALPTCTARPPPAPPSALPACASTTAAEAAVVEAAVAARGPAPPAPTATARACRRGAPVCAEARGSTALGGRRGGVEGRILDCY